MVVGPARSDVAHWNYETLDLAPAPKKGTNTIPRERRRDLGRSGRQRSLSFHQFGIELYEDQQRAVRQADGGRKSGHYNPNRVVFGTVNSIPNSIFRSDDNGASWTTVANPAITQLLNMTADRRVYERIIAGSAGSGIFYGEPVPASVTGLTLGSTRDTHGGAPVYRRARRS